jgi:hypothetical protein
MPFPSQLSAGQLTQSRKTRQWFRQYLVFCPSDVIWQTQPLAQVDGSTPYIDFDWDGTDQGDRADVREGMTVLISTTTDYKATAIYRGRVRLAPDATTFYIDENSTNLETTYYVTVLDDYDIHERLEQRISNVAYIDGSLTYETIPPLISGLQSAYVDISGSATVNFTFTATAEATANGASISTYLWEVDDGTINSGAGTASIDVDFPGYATNEHRWVRLTVTDDNGVSNYFVFEVYTVSLADTSSSVIKLDTGDVQISATLDEGFNASIRAWDGISTVLDRTRCTIFSVDNYDGTATPITQNVAFVGRLSLENSTTAGDQQYGTLQDTTFTIEGFATQLLALHGPGLYLTSNSSPSAWGQIEALTIKRAIVHMLARYSTFLTVSGLTFNSDAADFRWDEFVIQEASLLAWIESVDNPTHTRLMFAADGQSTLQHDARLDGTDGLTTIIDFVVDSSGDCDMVNFGLSRQYRPTHSQAVIGAATYNTTSNSSTVYKGRAPAQTFGPGWETALLNGLIMPANLSNADAITQVSTWTGNYFANLNPVPEITLEFMPGYYWLVPTVHQLYSFTIAAADTTRGIAYTTSDKWLCVQADYSYNAERGYYIPTGRFVYVATGGNVGIWADVVPPVSSLELPALPGINAGLEPLNPLINLPIDDGDIALPGGDWGQTQPNPTVNPPINCELLNVSMKTGQIVTTTGITVFGEPYLVTVEGDGIVQAAGDWTRYYEFDETFTEGWTVIQGQWANPTNLFTSIVGSNNQAVIEQNFSGFDGLETVRIHRTWNQVVKTGQGIQVTVTHSGGSDVLAASIGSGATAFIDVDMPAPRDGVTYIEIELRHNTVGDGGSASIIDFSLIGNSNNPPPGTVSPSAQYGDAFYYGYGAGSGNAELYPFSNGFQVDSARPSGIPTYQSNHVYQFITTGTGSPLGFRFLETDYSDNSNNQLRVTCCGQGMTQA